MMRPSHLETVRGRQPQQHSAGIQFGAHHTTASSSTIDNKGVPAVGRSSSRQSTTTTRRRQLHPTTANDAFYPHTEMRDENAASTAAERIHMEEVMRAAAAANRRYEGFEADEQVALQLAEQETKRKLKQNVSKSSIAEEQRLLEQKRFLRRQRERAMHQQNNTTDGTQSLQHKTQSQPLLRHQGNPFDVPLPTGTTEEITEAAAPAKQPAESAVKRKTTSASKVGGDGPHIGAAPIAAPLPTRLRPHDVSGVLVTSSDANELRVSPQRGRSSSETDGVLAANTSLSPMSTNYGSPDRAEGTKEEKEEGVASAPLPAAAADPVDPAPRTPEGLSPTPVNPCQDFQLSLAATEQAHRPRISLSVEPARSKYFPLSVLSQQRSEEKNSRALVVVEERPTNRNDAFWTVEQEKDKEELQLLEARMRFLQSRQEERAKILEKTKAHLEQDERLDEYAKQVLHRETTDRQLYIPRRVISHTEVRPGMQLDDNMRVPQRKQLRLEVFSLHGENPYRTAPIPKATLFQEQPLFSSSQGAQTAAHENNTNDASTSPAEKEISQPSIPSPPASCEPSARSSHSCDGIEKAENIADMPRANEVTACIPSTEESPKSALIVEQPEKKEPTAHVDAAPPPIDVTATLRSKTPTSSSDDDDAFHSSSMDQAPTSKPSDAHINVMPMDAASEKVEDAVKEPDSLPLPTITIGSPKSSTKYLLPEEKNEDGHPAEPTTKQGSSSGGSSPSQQVHNTAGHQAPPTVSAMEDSSDLLGYTTYSVGVESSEAEEDKTNRDPFTSAKPVLEEKTLMSQSFDPEFGDLVLSQRFGSVAVTPAMASHSDGHSTPADALSPIQQTAATTATINPDNSEADKELPPRAPPVARSPPTLPSPVKTQREDVQVVDREPHRRWTVTAEEDFTGASSTSSASEDPRPSSHVPSPTKPVEEIITESRRKKLTPEDDKDDDSFTDASTADTLELVDSSDQEEEPVASTPRAVDETMVGEEDEVFNVVHVNPSPPKPAPPPTAQPLVTMMASRSSSVEDITEQDAQEEQTQPSVPVTTSPPAMLGESSSLNFSAEETNLEALLRKPTTQLMAAQRRPSPQSPRRQDSETDLQRLLRVPTTRLQREAEQAKQEPAGPRLSVGHPPLSPRQDDADRFSPTFGPRRVSIRLPTPEDGRRDSTRQISPRKSILKRSSNVTSPLPPPPQPAATSHRAETPTEARHRTLARTNPHLQELAVHQEFVEPDASFRYAASTRRSMFFSPDANSMEDDDIAELDLMDVKIPPEWEEYFAQLPSDEERVQFKRTLSRMASMKKGSDGAASPPGSPRIVRKKSSTAHDQTVPGLPRFSPSGGSSRGASPPSADKRPPPQPLVPNAVSQESPDALQQSLNTPNMLDHTMKNAAS